MGHLQKITNYKNLIVRVFQYCIVLSPILIIYFWNSRNVGGDHTPELYDFGSAAFRILDQNSLSSFYLIRAGKPTILSAITAFFLWATPLNFLNIVLFLKHIFLGLFSFFILRIAKNYLQPWVAVGLCFYISTSPLVVGEALSYDTKMPFLTFSVAYVYYFLCFQKRPTKLAGLLCGAFLGLAICMRPIDSVILFSLPLLNNFYSAYKRKDLQLKEILAGLVLVIPPVVLMILYGSGEALKMYRLPMLYFGFGYGILICLTFLKTIKNFSYWLLIGAVYFIGIIWWLPFYKELYLWSRGAASPFFLLEKDPGFLPHLQSVIWQVGGIYFIGIAGLFLFSLRNNRPSKSVQVAFCVIVITVLIQPITGLLIAISDNRYFYLAILFLIFIFSIRVLKSKGYIRLIAQTLMLFTTTLHLIYLLWPLLGPPDEAYKSEVLAPYVVGSTYWHLKPRLSYPPTELFEQMKKDFSSSENYKLTVLHFFSATRLVNIPSAYFDEPSLFVHARDLNLKWKFDVHTIPADVSWKVYLENYKEQTDYFLLFAPTNNSHLLNEKNLSEELKQVNMTLIATYQFTSGGVTQVMYVFNKVSNL